MKRVTSFHFVCTSDTVAARTDKKSVVLLGLKCGHEMVDLPGNILNLRAAHGNIKPLPYLRYFTVEEDTHRAPLGSWFPHSGLQCLDCNLQESFQW